jgi:hypothetical protein
VAEEQQHQGTRTIRKANGDIVRTDKAEVFHDVTDSRNRVHGILGDTGICPVIKWGNFVTHFDLRALRKRSWNPSGIGYGSPA